MDIEWIKVEPGKIFVGSDNRSILFGGVGPRHEVRINYAFEISYQPIDKESSKIILQDENCHVASESEWTLAIDRCLIIGNNEVEELSDRIQGSYWSKYCDGRAHIEDNWLMKVSRKWVSGKPKSHLIPKDGNCNFFRLVRRSNTTFENSAPQLPNSSDKSRILIEELMISLFFGIIPSFVWASFNASPGYISEGWLNLVFGGLFIGVFTIIFWRPKTKSWHINQIQSLD